MMSGRPLTIALLLATPGGAWGGMEQHTADLSRALAAMGHRVHVLGHRAYEARFPAPVRFHALPVQLGRHNPLLHFLLRRNLRQMAPDILHAQGNKAARLAGKVGGPNTVRIGTVHGIKSSHTAFDRMDRVIAVSPAIKRALTHPRSHLIYNGARVDEDSRLSPSEADLSPGTIHVIAAGRLESVKGFDRLIHAWSLLGPAADGCHLTIYGEGSQRPELAQQIRGLGLDNTISLPGYSPCLARHYRQARLSVISSDREGFPYVLIESLLCGCPVVSTPVSGPMELLPPEAISEGHEPDAIASVLTRALANLEGLAEREATAMAFARANLTVEAMAAKTEALYREVLPG